MNFKKGKNLYKSTKIPKDLNQKISKIIHEYESNKENNNQNILEKINKKILTKQSKIILSTAMSFCFLFVILLNTNVTFAKTAKNIPIIGKVAEILTWADYHDETENSQREIKIPEVAQLDNEILQNKINNKIAQKIVDLLNETEKSANQIAEEIGKNNINGSIYGKYHIRIDYEVKYNKDNILSFILIKEEGLNTSSKDIYTYNYNLETEKEIKLEDILGKDYKKIVDKQVYKQIEEQEKSDKNIRYFHADDEYIRGEDNYFHGISENQSFYINKDGNPVIIFDKYSIAAGYMGTPEFEILK